MTLARSWPVRASVISRFSTSVARDSLTSRMRPSRSAASGCRIWFRMLCRASASCLRSVGISQLAVTNPPVVIVVVVVRGRSVVLVEACVCAARVYWAGGWANSLFLLFGLPCASTTAAAW